MSLIDDLVLVALTYEGMLGRKEDCHRGACLPHRPPSFVLLALPPTRQPSRENVTKANGVYIAATTHFFWILSSLSFQRHVKASGKSDPS